MIAYQRNEIDAGPFAELMPGAKFYQLPELPTITFEANRTKYKVTDLQTLNENAVELILKILEYCCVCDDVSEFNCWIPEGTDENHILRITDIISAFGWSAKKGGRNGFALSGKLVIGCHRKDDVLTFDIVKEHAKAIYDYFNSTEAETVSYYGIVLAIVSSQVKMFSEVLK